MDNLKYSHLEWVQMEVLKCSHNNKQDNNKDSTSQVNHNRLMGSSNNKEEVEAGEEC